jgi:nitroreductase
MELYEAITTRRSVRSFRKDPVEDSSIEKVLRAAMLAPSAANQQPWKFIVVRDRAKLDGIALFHPYCKMIKEVGVAVIVCADPTGKKWADLWPQDCSAAVQNLLLAARDEGLGAVWTGVYPLEDRMAGCRKLFNIPDHVFPFAVIPIGYPKDPTAAFKKMDRYKPDLVYRDSYK